MEQLQSSSIKIENIKTEPIFKRTKFIDLRSDFAFKKLFFEEPNKDMLIDFLNALFDGKRVITDLVYNRTEHSGDNITEGKAIFDLLCTGIDGARYLIEVQRAYQKHFIERSIFYTSRLISCQAIVGDWDYKLDDVLFIGLLDKFELKGMSENEYLHSASIRNDKTGENIYNGLGYIYIEPRRALSDK